MRHLASDLQAASLDDDIDLGQARGFQPRREDLLPDVADLILDLAFLPARRRRAATGSKR
jgi:hypothetical protein